MARRRSIKNVCSCILGSFVSRNNDCEGYWGMGILYRYARERGKSDLTIDLMTPLHGSNDGGVPPELVGRRYGAMFQSQLIHAKIDPAKVTAAQIEVRFETSGDLPPPPQDTWGQPFVCTITVTDDVGKTWNFSKAGICGPHDSRRELRRLPIQWGAI